LLVMTSPHEGKDDEFNDWYDEVHLREVLAVPGFVGARRFRAVPSVRGALPDQPYLAIYEIEADDLDAVQQALTAAATTMDISPTLDRSKAAVFTYQLMTEAP
jgi:hypothetical protein